MEIEVDVDPTNVLAKRKKQRFPNRICNILKHTRINKKANGPRTTRKRHQCLDDLRT